MDELTQKLQQIADSYNRQPRSPQPEDMDKYWKAMELPIKLYHDVEEAAWADYQSGAITGTEYSKLVDAAQARLDEAQEQWYTDNPNYLRKTNG